MMVMRGRKLWASLSTAIKFEFLNIICSQNIYSKFDVLAYKEEGLLIEVSKFEVYKHTLGFSMV